MSEERKFTLEPESNDNFIDEFIRQDLKEGVYDYVHTRFPPEPNGYLHIGHCKALVIDFGTAVKYNGQCNLRMDDTNPAKEDEEYVDAIKDDIHWLGFDWEDRFYYGSDYFEEQYKYAEELIKKGLAYICELTPEQFPEYRGDLLNPAVSPYRDRPADESLDLFRRMRAGEFPEGKYTLRAKIDLASGNFNMRDPVLYRIRYIEHHRQGNKWCIYPMYDFAHPLQDALEGITHSLCSLEYEDHRPLYNWVIDNCDVPSRPRQIEFARLNITNTVLSKRYLRYLVENGIVDGWDDPRMPTLCGLRRRGYTPAAILDFIDRVGVSKANSMVDIGLLEHCIREDLNTTAPRRVAVLQPVKVIIDNYPEDKTEYFDFPDNPADPDAGTRPLPFTKEIYIEAEDFAEVPPPKYHRLKPGGEVRLMNSYIIKCVGFDKNPDDSITAIHATADLETGTAVPTDRKVRGTIHWLSAEHAVETKVVLYDRLFTEENMNELPEGKSYVDFLNPESAAAVPAAMVEASLKDTEPGDKFQFVRIGYFAKDTKTPGTLNRIVTLKDSFPKK
ncbi:MAG: glutamine--tRNA ligase/YqeY domain fusion protein [Clostridiales bacterium]|nr:glutamine--tRNA ligase/YqeY domain fusion protein [Clostridiales bacterium]